MFAWYFVWYLSEIWMIFLDIRMIYRVCISCSFHAFFMPSIQKSAFWQMAEPKAARRQRIGTHIFQALFVFFRVFSCLSCLFVSFHPMQNSHQIDGGEPAVARKVVSHCRDTRVSLLRRRSLGAETRTSHGWDTRVARPRQWWAHARAIAGCHMPTGRYANLRTGIYGLILLLCK